jgi:HK97 family phage major capsid protein
MRNLPALREKRAAKRDALKAIVTKAESDNRDLTAEETQAFDAGQAEIRTLDQQIQRAEFLAEDERRADADPVDGSGRPRELRNYSLARALQGSMTGKITGLEAEIHQDLSRGRETRGVMVPTEILMEARALTTTTPAGGAGGQLVGTSIYPVRDHPRPRLIVEQMGATVLRNLTGNLSLPVLSESGTVGWIAEHANVTASDPKFAKTDMSPKTVGGQYELSRRMILQSAESIEDLLRRDLGQLLQGALDRAAIAGTGTANQPRGILNTVGVEAITLEDTLSDTAAEMIAALELDDLTGSRAFLTNPGVMKLARKTKDADGHTFSLAELFHGERIEQTTQVPNNLGTGTDENALIYGQWSELVIGYWSGVDILVNPYADSVASKGGVLIHAFLDADVAVRTPNAFVKALVGADAFPVAP